MIRDARSDTVCSTLRATRDGVWRNTIPLPPNVSGKRLGIVGLGTIGRRIAQRGQGFDLEIGYHNRKPRADVPFRYFPDLMALAEWADYLVVATPGGAGTRHLINAEVLDALCVTNEHFKYAMGHKIPFFLTDPVVENPNMT